MAPTARRRHAALTHVGPFDRCGHFGRLGDAR